jgi:hypothetical protein
MKGNEKQSGAEHTDTFTVGEKTLIGSGKMVETPEIIVEQIRKMEGSLSDMRQLLEISQRVHGRTVALIEVLDLGERIEKVLRGHHKIRTVEELEKILHDDDKLRAPGLGPAYIGIVKQKVAEWRKKLPTEGNADTTKGSIGAAGESVAEEAAIQAS